MAKAVGNRTDLVQLVQVLESGHVSDRQKYMVCDFTKWEKLARHSKRDHCKNLEKTNGIWIMDQSSVQVEVLGRIHFWFMEIIFHKINMEQSIVSKQECQNVIVVKN